MFVRFVRFVDGRGCGIGALHSALAIDAVQERRRAARLSALAVQMALVATVVACVDFERVGDLNPTLYVELTDESCPE